MITIYRVQAGDGRGPFRPGLSRLWEEQPNSERPPVLVPKHRRPPKGWSVGCGCRTREQLFTWFSRAEAVILASMGYRPVAMHAERVVVEDVHQVVFFRRLPLYQNALILDWPHETA